MKHLDLEPPYRMVFGRHGPMLVNLEDRYVGQAIARYGEYGEIEFQFMRDRIPAGRDAVEVGANMGSHTVPLARLLAAGRRRLFAVEPQPVVFQNMCANVALNRLLNVQAENCACAAIPGWLSFQQPDYTARGNFGGVSMQDDLPAAPGVQRVRSVPLDDLLDDSWDVGFLKIDVEGFEQQVLQGAQRTIARCRPVIYLENDRADKSRALIEGLWAAGYKLWFHKPALFNPDNFAKLADNAFPRLISLNMLALPSELPSPTKVAPVSDAAYFPRVRR